MMHFFSRWVPRHAGRDVQALDHFWTSLRRGTAPDASADLANDVAAVAKQLSGEIPALDASDAFVARLRVQLEDAHSAQSAQPSQLLWTGPAIGPNSRRQTPVRETEEQQVMPASIDATTSLDKRRRSNELWKFAAAVAVFAVVGLLLVLLLRDDDEPVIVEPGPTPTVAPTPAGTPSAAPSPTSTLEPEATSTLATTATEGLSPGFATLTAEAVAEAATEAAAPTPDWASLDATVITIPLDGHPDWASFGAGSLWVSLMGDDGRVKLSRIDPATNAVIATIDTGGSLYTASDDGIYVSRSNIVFGVAKIDPASNEFVYDLEGPEGFDPSFIAVNSYSLWVADIASASNRVNRFDPDTGALVASVDVAGPLIIGASEDSVWVPSFNQGTLTRIDPASNTIAGSVLLTPGVVHAQEIDGVVWVANRIDGTLTLIDPDTLSVITTYTIANADGSGNIDFSAFAVVPDGIWIAAADDGRLYRLDPETGEVVGSVLLPTGAQVIPVGAGSIWIYDYEHDAVLRVTPNG